MTVGDYPKYLAVGYLVNQNIIKNEKKLINVEYDEDINTVVVRTAEKTDFEIDKKKRIKTSGCANGTIFEDIIEEIEKIKLKYNSYISNKEIFELSKKINTMPSLYLKSGAIHGCVLCKKNQNIAYFEDVGRHNAIDKLAGFMFLEKISPQNKILYTTGRLTSEMVIKTVIMKIPILASRSGFTAWGVDLALKSNLTMIARLRGKRYILLSGKERIKA
tara:strand:+ start:344 stop:997 length:654 start_codon:yes stop_codon:yes gene_type:complete